MTGKRLLLLTTTTGYQTRAFETAARSLGVDLIYATDHCHRLDDPWRDGAIAVKFGDLERSLRSVVDAVRTRPVHGILAVGDRPAVLAARVAEALGLPWHRPAGALAAHHKLQTRGRLVAAGLPAPWFVGFDVDSPLVAVADRLRFPCVVKPAALSASRGVMRADTPAELERAVARLRRLLKAGDIVAARDPAAAEVIVEGFVPGREYALEGLMNRGALHVLAIFDKPDPLDGPFFEETIYVTPPMVSEPTQRAMAGVFAHAALALGLWHGPIHAECRVNEEGIFVLEVAARPIGGLCARALAFVGADGNPVSLEELAARHALGESLEGYAREASASGVMMIPVPGRGHFRRVEGVVAAARVTGVEDVVITVKPGQLLEPWPEGHSYPGFIFARAPLPEQVVQALREAHEKLRFVLDTALPLA